MTNDQYFSIQDDEREQQRAQQEADRAWRQKDRLEAMLRLRKSIHPSCWEQAYKDLGYICRELEIDDVTRK